MKKKVLNSENPKQQYGDKKVPIYLWPEAATILGTLGMLEGDLKYGRGNYRATKVLATTYVAAAMRHLNAFMECEDLAPDTGNPHLGNALACLAILADTSTMGTLIDDRNYIPATSKRSQMLAAAESQVAILRERFKDKKPKRYDNRDSAA